MNREVEIKEMLAVARELMREWHRMRVYSDILTKGGDDVARGALAYFDDRFPKEAP